MLYHDKLYLAYTGVVMGKKENKEKRSKEDRTPKGDSAKPKSPKKEENIHNYSEKPSENNTYIFNIEE